MSTLNEDEFGRPEFCYAKHPSSGSVVLIVRDEPGYRDVLVVAGTEDTVVDDTNTKLGITAEQVDAMLAGSMFGWNCPGSKRCQPKAG